MRVWFHNIGVLEGMLVSYSTNTASYHYRPIVALNFYFTITDGQSCRQGMELPNSARPPEFIVERHAAYGSFEHNVKAARDI